MNSSSSVSSTSESEDANAGANNVFQPSTSVENKQDTNTTSQAIDLSGDTVDVIVNPSTTPSENTDNNEPTFTSENVEEPANSTPAESSNTTVQALNSSTSVTNISTTTEVDENIEVSAESSIVVVTTNVSASIEEMPISIEYNNGNNEGDQSPNITDPNSIVSENDVQDDVGIVCGSSENRRRGQQLLNRKDIPASFISGSEGQHLRSMILAQAKREGYHLTIGFGKRIGWLRQGEESFFKAGGILQDYKVARFDSLRKKLAQAENHALQLFNTIQHNNNESNPTEDLPTYVKHFFDYFDWKEENQSNRNDAIQHRDQIGRSLIGQQASLDGATQNIILLSTRAEANRTSGTGDVATDIEWIEPQPSTVSNNNNTIENNDSSISFESSIQNNPRRRPSSASRSNERTPTRQRRQNRDYCMESDPFLSPSTSQRRRLNFNNMFEGFENVANSLSVLPQSNRFRRVSEIYNDIISTIERRQQLENSGVINEELHNTLTNKIAALNQELSDTNSFDSQVRSSDSVSMNDQN